MSPACEFRSGNQTVFQLVFDIAIYRALKKFVNCFLQNLRIWTSLFSHCHVTIVMLSIECKRVHFKFCSKQWQFPFHICTIITLRWTTIESTSLQQFHVGWAHIIANMSMFASRQSPPQRAIDTHNQSVNSVCYLNNEHIVHTVKVDICFRM